MLIFLTFYFTASKQIFGEVSDSDGEDKMEMLEEGDSLDMMSTQQSMDYSLADSGMDTESSKSIHILLVVTVMKLGPNF